LCEVIESDYDGLPLEDEMTKEFVEDMIDRFKRGKKIHKKYAYQIVMKAKQIFYNEPTMPEVKVEEGKRLTVCGDTHGIFHSSAQPGVALTWFG
jgi:serine/threonine-protein phosphatase 5